VYQPPALPLRDRHARVRSAILPRRGPAKLLSSISTILGTPAVRSQVTLMRIAQSEFDGADAPQVHHLDLVWYVAWRRVRGIGMCIRRWIVWKGDFAMPLTERSWEQYVRTLSKISFKKLINCTCAMTLIIETSVIFILF
jgi:hypothetical protein